MSERLPLQQRIKALVLDEDSDLDDLVDALTEWQDGNEPTAEAVLPLLLLADEKPRPLASRVEALVKMVEGFPAMSAVLCRLVVLTGPVLPRAVDRLLRKAARSEEAALGVVNELGDSMKSARSVMLESIGNLVKADPEKSLQTLADRIKSLPQ